MGICLPNSPRYALVTAAANLVLRGSTSPGLAGRPDATDTSCRIASLHALNAGGSMKAATLIGSAPRIRSLTSLRAIRGAGASPSPASLSSLGSPYPPSSGGRIRPLNLTDRRVVVVICLLPILVGWVILPSVVGVVLIVTPASCVVISIRWRIRMWATCDGKHVVPRRH